MVTPIVWSGVANLHGVATSGKWLFGTGYDLSKIAVVDMDTNYEQTREYAFPADFPTFANPYADGVFHGEALTVGTDGFLYACSMSIKAAVMALIMTALLLSSEFFLMAILHT